VKLQDLENAVVSAAAIRRVRRLQPAGGPGDKVFPPTFPGDGPTAPPRHVFEKRRIGGETVTCVLIDSVQSQANRLEEALDAAIARGDAAIPRIVVDFSGTSVADVGNVSTLTAPHRVFDAILRDSRLDDTLFRQSPLGEALVRASVRDASALFRHAPTALVFGAWNSTGEGGGMGAKFARVVVSEIIGVNAVSGARTGSRIDPLGIRAGVKIVKSDGEDWQLADDAKNVGKKAKLEKPSQINHGNIAPTVTDGIGVTMDYALQTWVLSFAGLRRLQFGAASPDAANKARTVLALVALLAALEQDVAGHALRSRCDLIPDTEAPEAQRGAFELIAADGTRSVVTLTREVVRALLAEAVEATKAAGLAWEAEPVRLVPDERLVRLVEESRKLALKGVDEGAEE
jgi:CRISPR-associated protein Csb1